jgi:hypothetical protein
MKIWGALFIFCIPLAFSVASFDVTNDNSTHVQYADEVRAPLPEGPPVNAPKWLAILAGWVAILVIEARMDQRVSRLHRQLDRLECYANARDYMLALRLDRLGVRVADDIEPSAERGRPDDWNPQRH